MTWYQFRKPLLVRTSKLFIYHSTHSPKMHCFGRTERRVTFRIRQSLTTCFFKPFQTLSCCSVVLWLFVRFLPFCCHCSTFLHSFEYNAVPVGCFFISRREVKIHVSGEAVSVLLNLAWDSLHSLSGCKTLITHSPHVELRVGLILRHIKIHLSFG